MSALLQYFEPDVRAPPATVARQARPTHHEADSKVLARQDDFIVAIAHELRNPLSAIRAAATLLARLEGDTSTPSARAAAIILRQVPQLTALVNDLLDAGRIMNGKLHCDCAPVCLREVVDTVLEMHCATLEEHHLLVHVALADLQVMGDRVRLVQILGNLLDNAIKFSFPGARIWLQASRTAQDRVVVTLRDEGAGIEPDQLESVFDLYRQSSHETTERGLGIGLAIVRGLVEQQGGSVRVHSDGPGRGSEFVLTLRS